jgi:hypothetical protein
MFANTDLPGLRDASPLADHHDAHQERPSANATAVITNVL